MDLGSGASEMSHLFTMPRHYALWNGEEVILLGYARRFNDVLAARVAKLPPWDRAKLRAIVSESQDEDYLIPVLTQTRHSSGEDWFTMLFQLISDDGPVVQIPIGDLHDINPHQLSHWIDNIHGTGK